MDDRSFRDPKKPHRRRWSEAIRRLEGSWTALMPHGGLISLREVTDSILGHRDPSARISPMGNAAAAVEPYSPASLHGDRCRTAKRSAALADMTSRRSPSCVPDPRRRRRSRASRRPPLGCRRCQRSQTCRFGRMRADLTVMRIAANCGAHRMGSEQAVGGASGARPRGGRMPFSRHELGDRALRDLA